MCKITFLDNKEKKCPRRGKVQKNITIISTMLKIHTREREKEIR